MPKIKTVDGNEACSYTSYVFTEVAGIYPITPSSTMSENIDNWSNEGMLNAFGDRVKVIQMQSEAGAAGLVHGSLQAGCLTTTYTASQGLLLMIPNMYKMAGEMLPAVIHVAGRSLSTHALSILGDHQDVYAARQTGFSMLASSSVQDAALLSAVAHLSAIKASLPFMHFFDGFRTSHELQKINLLEKDELMSLIDHDAIKKFRDRSLNPARPVTRGTSQGDDIYFQSTEVRNKYYEAVPDIVNDYMQKVNKLANTDYKPFNYYGDSNAKHVIIAMGSVCETIKETVDYLNNSGEKLGLVEVHLYRPFSTKYLLDVLPKSVTHIAVLDRTKEPGSVGEPLYLDVVSAINNSNITIVGGRYGLSSKNTNAAQIKAVYDFLKNNPKHNFTIGIDDDVTNLSLKVDNSFNISTSDEFLLYGYGSDGMVGAAKSIIKLIGDTTDKYVQGYFQYDSKKSGGVTLSHLRFNDSKIRSTYYVENPSLVVCTKDTYLDDFDMLNKIRNNGIFVLNTIKNEQEILDFMGSDIKRLLLERNIKFYTINAYLLAHKVGLKNKISSVMESVIVNLSNVVEPEIAKNKMKELINDKFSKKGMDVVEANYKLIDESMNYLKQINIPNNFKENEISKVDSLVAAMNRREGDELPVSAFLDRADGTFESGTTLTEKRNISDIVPRWLSNNCIQCNRCSLVCPHGVIRPFLLSQEEYDKAPDYVQNRCIKPLEKNLSDYYYIISISIADCTGCGVCMKECPGKGGEKALIPTDYAEERKNNEQKIADYLFYNIKDKGLMNPTIMKSTQFKEPKFAFSSACAGCGETAYIKLLTQMMGDELIIANATGCSSIYGGSTPSTPYTVPWANSLFEDNAEFGYGILVANNLMHNRVASVMENNMNNPNKELFTKWLENRNDRVITKEVFDSLDFNTTPKELNDLKDYIIARSVWTIGGDGWAYDIGFGGIDHVVSTNENVNILILDSQVYSNTGGQSSKSSPKGAIAAFASNGKPTATKDLARMLMAYPHVYVAQVSLGANPQQLVKVFNEAASYNGPSVIIAYTPCIAHNIKGGLENSVEQEKLATKSGYFPIFRYNPMDSKFYLDSKDVDFNLYESFLENEGRYQMLKNINPNEAQELLEANKQNAMDRYNYYKSLLKD